MAKRPFGFLILKLALLIVVGFLSCYFSDSVITILLNAFLFVCTVIPDLFAAWWAAHYSTLPRPVKVMVAAMAIIIAAIGIVQIVFFIIYPTTPLEFITKVSIIVPIALSVVFSLVAEILMLILDRPKNGHNGNTSSGGHSSSSGGTPTGNGTPYVPPSSNGPTKGSHNKMVGMAAMVAPRGCCH